MVDGHNQIQQCFSIILCPNAQLCNSPDLHNLGLILTVGKESNPADYISYIPGPSWVDAMKKNIFLFDDYGKKHMVSWQTSFYCNQKFKILVL